MSSLSRRWEGAWQRRQEPPSTSSSASKQDMGTESSSKRNVFWYAVRSFHSQLYDKPEYAPAPLDESRSVVGYLRGVDNFFTNLSLFELNNKSGPQDRTTSYTRTPSSPSLHLSHRWATSSTIRTLAHTSDNDHTRSRQESHHALPRYRCLVVTPSSALRHCLVSDQGNGSPARARCRPCLRRLFAQRWQTPSLDRAVVSDLLEGLLV